MANQDSIGRLSAELKRQARNQGFEPVGIACLPGGPQLQLRTAALQRWLAAGHQADMSWMAKASRTQAGLLLDGAKSLLAVGLNYYVRQERKPGCLAVARYGWGRDYHRVVSRRLRRLGHWLEEQCPGSRWRVCVDTAPILDKAWAEEAGLGWIGKHSNLIQAQRGSWMVIGHLLTTEKLQADRPSTPLCGRCHDCIDACPTKAIREPFVVDARRCIAYHTIENRSQQLPSMITATLGPWVAGCDICQDVCPWNHGPIPSSEDPDVQPRPWLLSLEREKAMVWSNASWDKRLQGSALRRIKPWMWRRNITSAQP